MVLTQDSVLSLLIAAGGKVRKADLVAHFKGATDCDDPAQRERNRELFKTLVNNVAFVKEIDGVRFVVARKAFQQVVAEKTAVTGRGEEEEGGQQSPPARGEEGSPPSGPEVEQEEASKTPSEPSAIELALRRTQFQDVKVKRMLKFGVQSPETRSGDHPRRDAPCKPFALPLRMPPPTAITKVQTCKANSEPPDSPKPAGSKKRPPLESVSSCAQVRAVKKVSEEPGEARGPSVVPLEQSEHQWLVKCAAGHWSQVYGLLLRDNQLAEKRDFTSGFTALHWAAKWGNSEMLIKILDISRAAGVDLDVNGRTHGGYTPLHIAALHAQEYILGVLVKEYGADTAIRDNCGKKAYHYLHKGVSETLREMLGEPRPQQSQGQVHQEKEEPEIFPELPKGLHSISRLFQPHVTGHKKKHKHRPSFSSLGEDPNEEREDGSGGFRHRLLSDALLSM